MKTTLILIFVIGIIGFSYSQDREPSQRTFKYLNDTTYRISADSSQFKQNRFAFGSIFGNDYRMHNKVGLNTYEGGITDWSGTYLYNPDSLIPNSDYVIQIPGISWWGPWTPYNTLSYQYEPTLRIPDENKLYFRPNDSSKAIFGFQHIDNNIQITDNDTRLRLYKSGNYTNPVLSNPWLSDRYFVVNTSYDDVTDYFNTDIPAINPFYTRQYNGREFFVNINLRRLDSTYNIQDDSVVLRIKLPCHIKNTTTWDTIKFSYVPRPEINSTDSIISALGEYRGIVRDTMISDPVIEEFIITRNMIPTGSRDITISAFFDLKGDSISNDYVLNKSEQPLKNQIDKILIDVIYEKRCDVGIDFISITTPAARHLKFGAFDQSIESKFKRIFDTVMTQPYTSRGIRFHKVYLRDEQGTQSFGQARYFSNLIGNIGISQDGSDYANLLTYHTGEKTTWNEIGNMNSQSNTPYFRKGSQASKVIGGYKFGYFLDSVTAAIYDTLNSEYETHLINSYYPGSYDTIRVCSEEHYLEYFGEKVSPQLYYEEHLNKAFGNKPWGLNLYANDKFWYQTFTGVFGKSLLANGDIVVRVSTNRPPTGEEWRLMNWNALIFGAKGLFNDRCVSNYSDSAKIGDLNIIGFGHNTQIYDSLQLDTTNFNIWDDQVGTDFLLLNYDYSNFHYFIDTNQVKTFGIRPERIYLGRKTFRTETKKLTDFANSLNGTENDLMNLRLQAAFMHGYKVFRHQHPKYDTTEFILDKFINLNGIRTRKLAQPNHNAIYTYDCPYEDTVRSFYNLTLLSQPDDTMMTGKWVIGLVNLRTDPLIHVVENDIITGATNTDSSLKFYTTSELEWNCQHGGKRISGDSMPATYWQNLYYKRLGCREVTIPFNFKYSTDTNQYALLKITELGVGNKFLDTVWYRQSKYYHKIDTVIGQDKNLVVRLSPGEGKLLSISVLPPQSLQGELTYSNQRKMIGHPIRVNDTLMINDSLYYHLVYHRQEGGQYRVYYRRSQPVTMTDSMSINSNLKWGPEKSLSDKIICIEGIDTLYSNTDCKYPAIVVRYDSVSQKNKAYIVFVCNGRQGNCTEPDGCSTSYVTVVENIINADDTVQNILPSRAISHACGDDYNRWGVPMINASRYGNYYVWPDSLLGITSAWKHPSDTVFNAGFDFFNSSFRFGTVSPPYLTYTQNPSLNTYSRIKQNEYSCAVVWQERLYGDDPNNAIYYSLLNFDSASNSVIHFLPDSTKRLNSSYFYNFDSSIVKLTTTVENCEYPIVFRNIEDSISLFGNTTYDVMTWQSYYLAADSLSFCNQPSYYYADTKYHINSQTIVYPNLYPDNRNASTTIKPRSRILHLSNSVLLPNETQGSKILYAPTNSILRAVNLEFVEQDVCPQTSQRNPRIWQYPHDYLQFANTPSNYIWTGAIKTHDDAFLPQLAARPYVSTYDDWWKNKRVFKFDSTISDIKTSAKTFYRGAKETIGLPLFGFGDTLDYSVITPFILDTKIINIDKEHLYPEIYSDKSYFRDNLIRKKDTVRTEWFRINTSSDLQFFSLGMNDNDVKIKIERESDGRKTDINLRRIERDKFESLSYKLINGGSDRYRLLFVKSNNRFEYQENILLIPNPYPDEFFRKEFDRTEIIDLNGINQNDGELNEITLSIYPNPAQDKLFLTGTLPSRITTGIDNKDKGITIIVFNLLGLEISRMSINSGITIEKDIKNIPPGIYFIRAEASDLLLKESVLPAVRQIVIER